MSLLNMFWDGDGGKHFQAVADGLTQGEFSISRECKDPIFRETETLAEDAFGYFPAQPELKVKDSHQNHFAFSLSIWGHSLLPLFYLFAD